jgi:hypothetical protein
VKDEVHPIVASQVTAKSHPTVASQEVSKVSEVNHPITDNPSPTVAAQETSNVAESISVEVKEVILQELADIEAVDVSQVTNKSAPVVTFQFNVEVQLIFKVSAETEVAVAAPNDALSVVNEPVVVELEVTFVIFQVVAVIVSAVTEVQVISVQVNVQSAVMLPVNSTLPLIVCKVTLDKSNSGYPSIIVFKAVSSKETL